MMSSTIRGIRRKKSSLSEVKIAVIGAPGVGKTALTVRFLTKRYIGDYDHQTECRYKHEALIDGDPVLFEILDTCPTKGEEGTLCSTEQAIWADGFVLVFSLLERTSLKELKNAARILVQSRESSTSPPPSVLVASKADMLHLREVPTHEAEGFAQEMECPYFEVSAAESHTGVSAAFQAVCREVLTARRRGKQSLLDRMLSAGKSRTPSPRTYLRGKSDSALP